MTAEEIVFPDITLETCFVPQTHVKKGRHISVKPGETSARHLHYCRIILDGQDAPLKFSNHNHETGLVCLKGTARVSIGDQSFEFSQYDSIYIPCGSSIEVKPGRRAVISPPLKRDLNILLGKNVEVERIMCGVTFSDEGSRTSFPPHEHAKMLEETYLYIDMPAPEFGIQMVYPDFQNRNLFRSCAKATWF